MDYARAWLYLRRQASSFDRYVLEQTLQLLFGWMPSIVGIAFRALFYRAIIRMEGVVAIEPGVRICFGNNLRLGRGVYLARDVSLYALPNGIEIGEKSYIMRHAELHVYNYRDLPRAGIKIGKNSLISEFNVLRGQGGIIIGDNVYTSPAVQIIAVNHVFDDPTRPFTEQGITARGIVIEDNVWIGSGAIILDGVRVGKGAVVAAGAVVSRDVPAHTLVGGVPAQVIRQITGESSVPQGLAVY